MLYFTINDILNNWKTMSRIDNNGSFVANNLQMDLSSPYKLTSDIYPALGQWWGLILNSDRYGITMVSDDYTIAFTKSKDRPKQGINGATSVIWNSASWLLDSSKTTQTDQIYQGSLKAIIGAIDPQFDWILGFQDQIISYEAKVSTNLDLLKDLCDKYSLYFLDYGVNANGQPRILVGTKTDIAGYLPFLTATNTRVSGYRDPSQVRIDDCTRYYNGDYFTHLYAYIDSSGGASSNTRQTLTDPGASYLLSNYPLEYEPTRGRYFIKNVDLLAKGAVPRYKSMSFNLSSSEKDAFSGQNLTADQVRASLYNLAVQEMKKYGDLNAYDFNFSFSKLTLPGTQINVDYREKVTDLDGTSTQTINTSQVVYLRNVKYDSKDLNSFI